MTIKTFAGRHRLRTRKDECGELIAGGRFGHIFDCADSELFGIVLEDVSPSQPSRRKALLCRRRQALASGFTTMQLGDYESVLLFDPRNREQTKLAILLVGARPRKTLSPERRAKLVAAGRGTQLNGRSTALEPPSAT
jgi:hypothetical protein